MSKNIEVEFRGPLSKEEYIRLKSFLNKKGSKRLSRKRLFIDYSTCINGEDLRKRKIDIRARITNNIPEMIIKIGAWKGSDSRKEISVLLQKGQFSNLVQAYAALGYSQGVLGIRNSLIYQYQDIEFALVEVPGHSYYFELEMLVSSKGEIKEARRKIKEMCQNLGLKLFSDLEFFNYIEKLNKEANKIFDINKDGEDYFLKNFKI